MGLFGFGRRRKAITEIASLANFINEHSAFVVQKGIFEYSRARAGHYAKVLFAEQTFLDMLERSRWQAFPLGVAMVTEVVDSVLNPLLRDVHGPESRLAALARLRPVALSVFDRYDVPAVFDAETWRTARESLAHNLDLIGLHPPKMAKDIPERFAGAYIDLMPIHPKLRQNEGPTIRNYLKVTMCNIHDELNERINGNAVVADLMSRPADTN